ncbi:MAG TPA: proline dehydrogenase family protein [Bryobacteraceae bacterium]|nr:proline dehydrogenase family protein [Bryobacteraceae bacterium]
MPLRPSGGLTATVRAALIALAGNRKLRTWAETSPAGRRLSSRFIAGRTLEDALAVCVRLRAAGITATLDYLGENVKSAEQAAACRDVFLNALQALHAAGLEPNVSIKLTQFGIDFSEEACEANVAVLVENAERLGGFVRVDMEGSAYTRRTLDLVTRVHRRHPACGAVLQACLYRSAQDVSTLIREGIRVRLVKGAYLEPQEIAFPSKEDVDRHYIGLAHHLLADGRYPAIATHDERIIDRIERFVANNRIPPDSFEFQMLYGIRRDLQKRLREDGYPIRVYVPFGEAWFPYFMRRLAERPANLLFLLRNLI